MSSVKDAIRHLSKDPKLRTIIETVELDYHWEPNVHGDVYWQLLRAIMGQQISVKAAQSIFNRFVDLFDKGYPEPSQLLQLPDDTLRSAGLSKQKVVYVKATATHFIEHQLLNFDWTTVSDEEIIYTLTAIKGIGEWSAQMILMFCLNRGDVLPTKDLGIQHTMQRLYGLQEKGVALERKMLDIGEAWRPYRTLACYYLWSWKHRWRKGSSL